MSKQFIFNILTIQRLRFQIVSRRKTRQEFIVRKGYIRTREEKCQPIPPPLPQPPVLGSRSSQVTCSSLCISVRKMLPWEQSAL